MRVFLFATLILILSLVTSSGYDFGAKVMANDTDMGKPLFDLPGGWTVGFWDTTGTHGYDQADPVYLHQACCRNNMIAANDVRLTSIGNHCPGSKVTFDNIDMNKPLTPLSATINYLNLYGSSAYDLDDPVYLHEYYCGAHNIDTMQEQNSDESSYRHPDEKADPLKIEDFEMRLPRGGGISVPGVSCIEFSDCYQLLVSDLIIDSVPKRISVWREPKVEVIHGVKANYYHILDSWLVKIDPAKKDYHQFSNEDDRNYDSIFAPMTAFICTNDVRLSRIENLSPGTKVVDFDPDQNKILTAPAMARFLEGAKDTGKIRYVDKNGNGKYDYPDDVYLNYPSGTTGDSVVVNNVRLTLVNASPGP
jgi:hypothetical protein